MSKNMWMSLLLSGASGVLLTLGFPKIGLHSLAWVSLVPLLLAVRDRTGR